jgi:hypothetical protein
MKPTTHGRGVRVELWCVLFAVPALAGCSDGGGVFGIFGGDGALEGVCGTAHKPDWDQQIILKIRMSRNATQIAEMQDVLISASHHDGRTLRAYDRDRSPDANGCVAFPLRGEGGYFFLGLGFPEGAGNCYVKGQVGGAYDGSFAVAQGRMDVDRQGRC